MKQWVGYAIMSMIFAGFTSVVAKIGLTGISGELGLAVRTLFVFVLVAAFTAATFSAEQFSGLNRHNVLWLGISAVTTTLSWIFYYKALKDGQVSTIALIDKGSIVVAVLLAALLLKEHITPRTIAGAALIVAGLVVIARK